MKLKHLLWTALAATSFSCERELPQPQSTAATVQLSTEGLPSYTLTKYQTLLAAQTDEADFVAKTRLLAYALTRYLGEQASMLDITDAGGVESTLPCDQTWLGDDGILRTLGTATGQTDAEVNADLSAIIDSRIEGDMPPAEQALLLDGLLSSLIHQGEAYTTRNYYPAADPATGDVIFVSYGVSWREAGYHALGYRWDLSSDQLDYAELPIAEAMAEGVILLDPIEIDPGTARYNDLCHSGPVYGGGGSSGGGGSGGSGNLDDDGEQKNGFTGGVVSPPPTLDIQCQGASGVRIARMHLTNPYEHFGKSEVYVNVSVYKSNDVAGTVKTNDRSSKSKTVTIFGITFSYQVGKQLADAPASAFSSTLPYLIEPTTGYTPNGGDWVLLEEGFCDLLYDGYDRMAISLVELDGGWVTTHMVDQSSMSALPYDNQQWAKQKYITDRWATNEIVPSDFDGDNEVYLVKTNGIFGKSQTQPGNASSWVLLQRF